MDGAVLGRCSNRSTIGTRSGVVGFASAGFFSFDLSSVKFVAVHLGYGFFSITNVFESNKPEAPGFFSVRFLYNPYV